MAHDWGSNIVTIQGNGTIRTIIVTKHLGGEIRDHKCYCVTIIMIVSNEKEGIIFANSLNYSPYEQSIYQGQFNL